MDPLPQPPQFFLDYLNALSDADTQALYWWASQNLRTQATDTIMDIVAPKATAEPE